VFAGTNWKNKQTTTIISWAEFAAILVSINRQGITGNFRLFSGKVSDLADDLRRTSQMKVNEDSDLATIYISK